MFCSSAQQSTEWFGRNNIPSRFSPKSTEGLETDEEDTGLCRHAGLSSLAIQKNTFISSAAEGRPFPRGSSTENGRCRTGIVLLWSRLWWWQLAARREKVAGRQQLDEAAASRGSSELCSHAHAHTQMHIFRNMHRKTCTHTDILTVATKHTRVWQIWVCWRMIPVNLDFQLPMVAKLFNLDIFIIYIFVVCILKNVCLPTIIFFSELRPLQCSRNL